MVWEGLTETIIYLQKREGMNHVNVRRKGIKSNKIKCPAGVEIQITATSRRSVAGAE